MVLGEEVAALQDASLQVILFPCCMLKLIISDLLYFARFRDGNKNASREEVSIFCSTLLTRLIQRTGRCWIFFERMSISPSERKKCCAIGTAGESFSVHMMSQQGTGRMGNGLLYLLCTTLNKNDPVLLA